MNGGIRKSNIIVASTGSVFIAVTIKPTNLLGFNNSDEMNFENDFIVFYS